MAHVCRLRLNGGRIVFGNFLNFNGLAKDMEVLKMVKRSRVSDVSITSQEEQINILGNRFYLNFFSFSCLHDFLFCL